MLANRLDRNSWRGLSCRQPEQWYNIILFKDGWGRKACSELKKPRQSAKCRVPHFAPHSILPFLGVAIFMYLYSSLPLQPLRKMRNCQVDPAKTYPANQLQRNSVNTVTNGPKILAILTRVFYKKMYGSFGQAAKKKWPQ